MFPQLFRVLPNFHECSHVNFTETRKESLYLYKINAQNIFCFHRVMGNVFEPISEEVVYCFLGDTVDF